MQSDEAYKHPQNCGNPLCEMCNYNRGYADGLKANRERCLEIVRQYYSCEMIAQDIEKKIMGGKMKSDGPYKHYRLCDEAPCVKGSCMACVYAEGRKSVQIKTPCPSCGFTTLCVDDSGNLVCSFLECKNPTEIANKEGRKAAEKEFKELLEMVDEFRSSIWWNGGLKFVKDFEDSLDSWKKARGIE